MALLIFFRNLGKSNNSARSFSISIFFQKFLRFWQNFAFSAASDCCPAAVLLPLVSETLLA